MAELDYQMALVLQHKFEQDYKRSRQPPHISDNDFLIAQELQEQYKAELETLQPGNNLVYKSKKDSLNSSKCLVDPSWEVVDPTPDVHVLFMAFDDKFFWKALSAVSVSWSKRMTTCAGICSYEGRGGMCKITLSEPLLKLRPRKDLVETLLHEMIHAYLFVTNNNRDRDGHGPEFHKHMYRINKEAGTNITVYHDFYDEVKLYQQHWWRCNGPCQKWKPYFGIVRRATNRAPGPNDRWWAEHSKNCGGSYIKVKEPEKQEKVPTSKKVVKGTTSKTNTSTDIRTYFPNTSTSTTSLNSPKTSKNTKTNSSQSAGSLANIHTVSTDNASTSSSKIINVIPSSSSNIHGFTNLTKGCTASDSFKAPKSRSNSSGSISFVKGEVKNNSNTIVINKKPSTSTEIKNSTQTDVLNSPTMQKPVFSGSGHKLTDSLNSDSSDYNAVRDHWLKKYGTANSDHSSKRHNIGIKRSNSCDGPKIKVPKLEKAGTSSCDTAKPAAECPICTKKIPIDMIDIHVDNCIEESEQGAQGKECIICNKKVTILEYEPHVSRCAAKHFGDSEIDEADEFKRCEVCKKDIPIYDFKNHKCTCRICDKEVPLPDFDSHVSICAGVHISDDILDIVEMKRCDECTKDISLNDFKSHECVKKSSAETIDCLACGKNILQSELNGHLDECFNLSNVFDTSNVPIEDDEEKNEDNSVLKFNCPFCMKLIAENEMNNHLDICLKIKDDSKEVEGEKSIFIDSFNSDDFSDS